MGIKSTTGALMNMIIKGDKQLIFPCFQAEERRRQETENKAMLSEEVERMHIDTEQEKAEIQVTYIYFICLL